MPGSSLFLGPIQIAQLVENIALDIAEAPRQRPNVIAPILNGAAIFAADLMRELSHACIDVEYHALHIKRNKTGMPEVKAHQLNQLAFLNKHVLVVDCINDTGHTARLACRHVLMHCAASVSYACLITRETIKLPEGYPVYFGLSMKGATEYLHGYGMDRNGLLRGLNSIHAESPSPDIPESLLGS